MTEDIKSPNPVRPGGDVYFLVAVLLLAAALRLFALSDVRMTHDSYEYLDLAREIASGQFFGRDYPPAGGLLFSRQLPPLFPAAIALVHRAGAPLETAGLVVVIACDLLAVGFAFAIGRRLGGRGAAVLAGLVACGSIQHLSYSTRIITETMFGLWTLATIHAALRLPDDPRPASAARLGLLAAAAYVTRENGLALLGLIGLSAAGRLLVSPGRPARSRLAGLALAFAAAYLAVALPFWIEVRARTGLWGLSLRERVITQVLNPSELADDAETTGLPPDTGSSVVHVFSQRLRLAKIYLSRGFLPILKRVNPWYRAWFVRLAFRSLLLAAAAALFFLDARARRPALLLALWAAGFFISTMVVAPILFVPRYNYPAVIIVEVMAGAGLAAMARAVGTRLGRRATRAALVILTVLLVAHGVWAADFVRREGQALAGKSAAAGVEAAVNSCRPRLALRPRPRVMDSKIFAAYYLDGTFTPLPEQPDEIPALAAAERPDLVVIDSEAIKEKRPGLAPLVSGREPPAGWQLGCQYTDPPSGKTITFYLPSRPPSKQ